MYNVEHLREHTCVERHRTTSNFQACVASRSTTASWITLETNSGDSDFYFQVHKNTVHMLTQLFVG